MRTLTVLEQTPIYTTNPTASNQKNPIILPNRSFKIENKKETWRLNAEAKGFTRSPSTNTHQLENRENAAATRSTKTNNNNGDDDEKIPEAVWERMISRILFSVAVPLVFGVALLQVFGVVKEKHLWDVPIWLPYLTTFLTFGCSALGIAYGTLSTSWDVERKGSLLGFEEAQRNWVEMWREDDESR